jgi:hypothetical protein
VSDQCLETLRCVLSRGNSRSGSYWKSSNNILLVTAVKTNRLGMHVMIVKNLDTTKKAANGTIGQITSIIFDVSDITNDTILSDELQITTIMHSHLPKFT